jgi:hypothetical protein
MILPPPFWTSVEKGLFLGAFLDLNPKRKFPNSIGCLTINHLIDFLKLCYLPAFHQSIHKIEKTLNIIV